MNNKTTFTLLIAAWFLAQMFNSAWAAAPPNPTESDSGRNTAGGTHTLQKIITALDNTGFGYSALANNSGSYNSAIGADALRNNTEGYFNTAIGSTALFFNTSGDNNTASGYAALNANTTGGDNVASGTVALARNTTGQSNSASGAKALFSNTIGNNNTATGANALYANITGDYNTAIGFEALKSNTTGLNNTASGAFALSKNIQGHENVACGYSTLFFNTTGSGNAASGYAALYSNATGYNNTASGYAALGGNTTGSGNVASGYRALNFNTTGSHNTSLGYQSFFKMTSGSSNLALGANAGLNLISGNNNVYIAHAGAVKESATIRIGSAVHTRTFIAGIRGKKTGVANAVPVFIDGNGQLGTINSSARFKKDIKDMSTASNKLLELRPVTYRYQQASEDGSNPLEYGLIAEEVAKVYPDLVAYGADGQIETVQYQKLTPMLVNEVKRVNASLQAEKDRNLAQVEEMKVQALEIALLKQQMGVLQTQAKNIEALTSRLSRIEAKDALGMAEKANAKAELNPG